jgi:hypothetical protein
MASDKNIAMRKGPALSGFPVKIRKKKLVRSRIAKLKAILYRLIFFKLDS